MDDILVILDSGDAENKPGVLTSMPEGAYATRGAGNTRALIGADGAYHYCSACGGWVPGNPSVQEEMTPKRRKGRSYHCKRCGYQLSFIKLAR